MKSTDRNIDILESIGELFQSVESYIHQHYIHEQKKNDFVVMDAKRWEKEKQVHCHNEPSPQATQATLTKKDQNRKPDPFDDILSLFRSAPCPEQDLEDILEAADAGFTETLLLLIDRTGKKASEIYKRASVDRKLFSKIRSKLDTFTKQISLE